MTYERELVNLGVMTNIPEKQNLLIIISFDFGGEEVVQELKACELILFIKQLKIKLGGVI